VQVQWGLNVPVGLSRRASVRIAASGSAHLNSIAMCFGGTLLHCHGNRPALVFGIAGTDFHLAVLVPTASSWPEGRASIGAIALAINVVNTQGFDFGSLSYSWVEVDCDRSQPLAALSRMLEEGPVDAVIGPDCSLACESTGILTAGRNIAQISYSCSSRALSDKDTYPTVRPHLPPRTSAYCA
jgi:hypothetical protein